MLHVILLELKTISLDVKEILLRVLFFQCTLICLCDASEADLTNRCVNVVINVTTPESITVSR